MEIVAGIMLIAGEAAQFAEQYSAAMTAVSDIEITCRETSSTEQYIAESNELSTADVAVTDKSIDEAEEALNDAEIFLRTEGRIALEKAVESQEHAGTQSANMTLIAQMGRETVIK